MHSNLCHEPAKDGEASTLNCITPIKNVSIQAHLPSKFINERLAMPRVRGANLADESRPFRCRRPLSGRPLSESLTTEIEVLALSSSPIHLKKPWPSRKGAAAEELVKYMSSVPGYLQRVERGENVQEKALHFGVIDWRRLEKWTSSQETDNKNVASFAINNTDLPSSFENQASSYPATSSCGSPAQRRETTSLEGHWDRPADSKHEYITFMQAEAGSLMEEEKLQSSILGGLSTDRLVELTFEDHEHVLDHLQGSSYVNGKPLSTIHGDTKNVEMCAASSGNVSENYSAECSISHDILQSGFLPDLFKSAAAISTKNGVTSTKFMTEKEVGYENDNCSWNSVACTDEKSSQVVDGINAGRKDHLRQHPSNSGLKWLNHSSSLKNMPSSHQHNDTSGLDISDDKGRSCSRGRRSPLRRILDPLLKSIYDGNSEPIATSPIHHSQKHYNDGTCSAGNESFLMNTTHRLSNASNSQVPLINAQGLFKEQEHKVPMKQALLKLAWKNGQPLFIFSTNNCSVLVASMRRTNRLDKEDSDCVYTILTARESKKKGGILIGHSKGRKPNLLYDVVGRVEVSYSNFSSSDSKNLEFSKQFVLVGDELLPSEGSADSVHSSELAAIIVKTQYQKMMGSDHNASSISISVILPSGIHGFSDSGMPSSLINRWKSGGLCDCGGWDEGCRLTILSDRLHETKVASSVQNSSCVKLFVQGGKVEIKHAFSMIAFKEGLHTIEFASSITSLQAFSVCIATLHDSCLHEKFSGINIMQDDDDGLTSKKTHHPPFSPVGRS